VSPSLHTTVLAREGLLRLFASLAGRTFLGAVDGMDCVELVFSDPDERGGNLVSIFTDGRDRGRIAHGFVADPEGYAAACGWRVP
jgi:hypothetical protein